MIGSAGVSILTMLRREAACSPPGPDHVRTPNTCRRAANRASAQRVRQRRMQQSHLIMAQV